MPDLFRKMQAEVKRRAQFVERNCYKQAYATWYSLRRQVALQKTGTWLTSRKEAKATIALLQQRCPGQAVQLTLQIAQGFAQEALSIERRHVEERAFNFGMRRRSARRWLPSTLQVHEVFRHIAHLHAPRRYRGTHGTAV